MEENSINANMNNCHDTHVRTLANTGAVSWQRNPVGVLRCELHRPLERKLAGTARLWIIESFVMGAHLTKKSGLHAAVLKLK